MSTFPLHNRPITSSLLKPSGCVSRCFSRSADGTFQKAGVCLIIGSLAYNLNETLPLIAYGHCIALITLSFQTFQKLNQFMNLGRWIIRLTGLVEILQLLGIADGGFDLIAKDVENIS